MSAVCSDSSLVHPVGFAPFLVEVRSTNLAVPLETLSLILWFNINASRSVAEGFGTSDFATHSQIFAPTDRGKPPYGSSAERDVCVRFFRAESSSDHYQVFERNR